MLVHDFYRVDPKDVKECNEYELGKYVMANKEELAHIMIHDNVVRRNLGRIDKTEFNAFDLRTFQPEKMKYFSGFLNIHTEDQTIGLNYYGITLLDDKVLHYLTMNYKKIYFLDAIRLRGFYRFVNESLQCQKWIIHYGI